MNGCRGLQRGQGFTFRGTHCGKHRGKVPVGAGVPVESFAQILGYSNTQTRLNGMPKLARYLKMQHLST
jgi:hypothetical protein